jgi:hypothetical protein
MPAYHILSLDGGGISGIFSARVLDPPIPLDAYPQVDTLIGYADALDLTDTIAWIQRNIMAPQVAAPKARRAKQARGSAA